MADKWPRSTATNASGEDGGTFSIKTLKAAMRRLDGLISDDVIAVTALCPIDKCYVFADEKGSVYAISPAMLHRVTKAVTPKPGDLNPILAHGSMPLGIPVIYADEGDEAAKQVRERVMRSLDAAVEVQAWWDSWK